MAYGVILYCKVRPWGVDYAMCGERFSIYQGMPYKHSWQTSCSYLHVNIGSDDQRLIAFDNIKFNQDASFNEFVRTLRQSPVN